MNACLSCGKVAGQIVGQVASARLVEVFADAFGADVAHLFHGVPEAVTLLACWHCALRWFSPQVIGDAHFYECLQKLPWYCQDDKPEYAFAKR